MRLPHLGVILAMVLASLVTPLARLQAQASASGTKRLALLVGCTKYPHISKSKLKDLQGPGNDLPIFASLLKEKFAFAGDDIFVLQGTDDGSDTSPSRANIVKGFERLIEQATPGTQVVILISGHGAQVPAAQDENELDGLDEVFLPTDTKPWSGKTIPNAIRDDEFGQWLDKLRGKGALVWAIFDCCHSGTMLRGPDDKPEEVERQLQPADLEIPLDALLKARGKQEMNPSVDLKKVATESKPGAGSLTVFYAAQSFEETYELPRPRGAPHKDKHMYGLFTYMIVQALQNQKGPLDYGELSQAVVNAYRREREGRPPTPLFDGDLGRQVLGAENWPTETTYPLRHNEDASQLHAGELHGLTTGSILAVHPPAGDPRDRQTILGYVRIKGVTPFDAEIEACDHLGTRAVEVKSLPDGARCQVVVRDVGEMLVKIAAKGTPNTEQFQRLIEVCLAKLAGEPEKLIDVQETPQTAEWSLHCVTAAEAKQLYGHDTKSATALLVQRIVSNPQELRSGGPGIPRVFASYVLPENATPEQAETLLSSLRMDLQKVFTWRNLWRVAGHTGKGTKEHDLRLTVKRLSVGDEIASDTVFADRERVQVSVENKGFEDWQVAVLYLDRNLGIQTWASGAIPGKDKSQWKPRNGTIDASVRGTEGLILLAFPLAQRQETIASHLEQFPVGVYAHRGVKMAESTDPFERLLKGATANRATRGISLDSSEQPVIVMRSWTTMGKADSTVP